MKREEWALSEITVRLGRPSGKSTHLSLSWNLEKVSVPNPPRGSLKTFFILRGSPYLLSFVSSLLVSLSLSQGQLRREDACREWLGDLQPSHQADKKPGWRQQGTRGHSPYQIVQFSKWPVAGRNDSEFFCLPCTSRPLPS